MVRQKQRLNFVIKCKNTPVLWADSRRIIMIKILNKSLQPVAILENAFNISYEKSFNAIWGSSFSLPLKDPKNTHCKPLNYMELTDPSNDEYIGLFRLIPTLTAKDENSKIVTYQCEHVLATLLDDVLFRYHQIDGLPTRESMQYIIDKQNTKRWRIGTVSSTLNRFFSYKFENENLLSCLFSIPQPLDRAYQWTWDTTSFPWTLNLIEPETEPSCEIRYGKNQRGIEKEEDPTVSYNRIYALGQGEGVNQTDITKVNNGIPFVEDREAINKYGLRQYVFVDRRFENAATLKATVQALLEKWKNPKITFRVNAADISSITKSEIDKLKMGKVVRMVDPDLGTVEARIMKESKPNITGSPGELRLEIASKSEDLATTQADLQRRQAINELYSQGNTCMDSHDFEDNADSAYPAVMMFHLPEELVKLNRLDLTFECTNFRAYSKAAKTTDTKVKTTRAGGGQTTSSGGGQTTSAGGGQTTSAGGGTTATTSTKTFVQMNLMSGVPENAVGSENYGYHQHEVQIPGSAFEHDHSVRLSDHTHRVSDHTHYVSDHTHRVNDHTHEVEIEGHGHDLEYGIYRHSVLPTEVTIKVDGKTVPYDSIQGEGIDLIPYLSKDSDGNVLRGFHRLEIKPNNLARVSAQVTSQFFLQSRGQYTV